MGKKYNFKTKAVKKIITPNWIEGSCPFLVILVRGKILKKKIRVNYIKSPKLWLISELPSQYLNLDTYPLQVFVATLNPLPKKFVMLCLDLKFDEKNKNKNKNKQSNRSKPLYQLPFLFLFLFLFFQPNPWSKRKLRVSDENRSHHMT